MVNRLLLKCLECDTEILTKTTIGHEDYVEFAFPCPCCKVEIRFGMNLDQANAGIEYINIINAEILNRQSELFHDNTIRLDSSFLIPKDSTPLISPFIMCNMILGDKTQDFMDMHYRRIKFPSNNFPIIEKLETHARNVNISLFNKNMNEFYEKGQVSTENEMYSAFVYLYEHYSDIFIPANMNKKSIIEKKIWILNKKHPKLLTEIVDFYECDDRRIHLLSELLRIRRDWNTKIASIVTPLYICFESAIDLNKFNLCQKRFDILKDFYKDCFETFCRISTLAASIEGCLSNGSLCVPKKGGNMSVESFERMPNGSKKDILNNLSIKDLFSPFMDSILRNGVGHNSSSYDVTSDTIKYRNTSRAGHSDYTITYNEFCLKTLKLYIQLEIVSSYLKRLIEQSLLHGCSSVF